MDPWYFEKKKIANSPSYQSGIEPEVEARYRREGARFINNVGQKLGLRFDTCATGVTYFHRFYMFHSFKDFNRYVMGAACLFLAGKVEETPKKCRDLIRAAQSFLTEQQFATFGDDPKEEVMTMERILLQTIQFDLQVEHPYTYLLKYAKTFKGDKAKIQKVVQMAWAFSNDSLCTTLCLQWQPEIIAIAVIHLACRLTKFEIVDWQGKPATHKGKWWDQFVEDISLKLLEDICHQVLDLYSQVQNKEVASPSANAAPASDESASSSRRPPSAGGSSSSTPASPAVKQAKPLDSVSSSAGSSLDAAHIGSSASSGAESFSSAPSAAFAGAVPSAALHVAASPVSLSAAAVSSAAGNIGSHYVPQQLYTSSFLSSEGSQSLASLIGSQPLPFSGAPLPPHLAGQPFSGAPYPGHAGGFGGAQLYYPGMPTGSPFGAPGPLPPLPATPAGSGGYPAFAGPHPGGLPPYAGHPGGYGFPGGGLDYQPPLPPGALPPLPPPPHHPAGGSGGTGGRNRGGGGNHQGGGGKNNKAAARSSLVQIL